MINGVILQIVQTTGTSADTLKAAADTVIKALPTIPRPVPHTEITLSLWDMTLKGGPVMIPIALLSILGIYIFIERYIIIGRASKTDSNFINGIRDFMHDGRLDSALSLCRSNNTPIARMIEKGLQRIGRPLADINAAIETVGNLEVAKLEKNIALLATVSGGAPMLGFLGTVTGMVKAFYDMSLAGNNIDIQLLSGGIYQAMITTVAGLVVGIIAYFCYNILVAKIQKVVYMLQFRASEFMDLLHEPAK
jgi:biopolymer transport protein ExbB